LTKSARQHDPIAQLRPQRRVRRTATLYLEEYVDGNWAVTVRPVQGWNRERHSDLMLMRWAQRITTSWAVQIPLEGESSEDVAEGLRRLAVLCRRIQFWQRYNWLITFGAATAVMLLVGMPPLQTVVIAFVASRHQDILPAGARWLRSPRS
jgi:hypothetical protein